MLKVCSLQPSMPNGVWMHRKGRLSLKTVDARAAVQAEERKRR